MKFSLLTLSVLVAIVGIPQTDYVTEEWSLSNGSSGSLDYVSCALDPSGNIVYVGNNLISTNSDIFLTCIHPSGSVAWQQTCPSSSMHDDYGVDLVIDGAGNIYLCGAYRNGSNYDYLVAKYSPTGSLLWDNYYHGFANGDDIPSAIAIDGAGNVYVTGTSRGLWSWTDYATVKYDNSGTQQWVRRYNHSNKPEIATDIEVDNAGNVIVLGASGTSFTNFDFAIRKYDPSGNVIATERHSTPGNGYDLPAELSIDASNYVYVIGTSESGAGKDMKIWALDGSLSTLWVDYVDVSGGSDEGYGIAIDPTTGDAVVIGYGEKDQGGTDLIVRKYNPLGSVIWEFVKSAANEVNIAKGRDVLIDAIGNIFATGDIFNHVNDKDFYTFSLKPNGELRWEHYFDSNLDVDLGKEVLNDGSSVYIVGSASNLGSTDMTTVKLTQAAMATPPDFNGEIAQSSFAYYENKGQLLNNLGQVEQKVRFYNNSSYPELYFTDNKTSLQFSKKDSVDDPNDSLHRIEMFFVDADVNQQIFSDEQVKTYLNFFLPHTLQGLTEIPGYQRLFSPEIYPKIDVHYYSNQNGFKYYLAVNPGGDPNQAVIQFDGATATYINGSMELVIESDFGEIIFDVPDAYQDVGGTITNLGSANWVQLGSNVFTFQVPVYDTSLPLYIQIDRGNQALPAPIGSNLSMEWSTFLGGSNFDRAYDVVANNSNESWVTGYASSALFSAQIGPTGIPYTGFQDVFVTKFSDLAVNEWISFLGGTDNEEGRALAVDQLENIYVVGITASSDFTNVSPSGISDGTLNGARDGFYVNLNNLGTVVLCDTYIGGDGWDEANGIALRPDLLSGLDVYIVGSGNGITGFPLMTFGNYNQGFIAGFFDAFIMRLDENNTNIWTSFFGGAGDDRGINVELRETSNNPVIVGYTGSPTPNSSCGVPVAGEFPFCDNGGAYYSQPYGGSIDAYIAEFDNTNQDLVWSTYFGGSAAEGNLSNYKSPDLITTSSGETYVVGRAQEAADFPLFTSVNAGSYNQPFGSLGGWNNYVARFDANKVQTWTTYFGGQGGDYVFNDIDVDQQGNVVMVGELENEFPQPGASFCTVPPFQEQALCNASGLNYTETNQSAGAQMGIVSFDNVDNIVWSTMFGMLGDNQFFGASITTDKLYVAGYALPTMTLWEFDTGSPSDYFKATNPVNGDATITRFDITNLFLSSNDLLLDPGSILVYPNPTDHSLTVDLDGLVSGRFQIQVVNALGELVLIKDCTSTVVNLDVFGIESGMYVLQVLQDSNTLGTTRFIKH